MKNSLGIIHYIQSEINCFRSWYDEGNIFLDDESLLQTLPKTHHQKLKGKQYQTTLRDFYPTHN